MPNKHTKNTRKKLISKNGGSYTGYQNGFKSLYINNPPPQYSPPSKKYDYEAIDPNQQPIIQPYNVVFKGADKDKINSLSQLPGVSSMNINKYKVVSMGAKRDLPLLPIENNKNISKKKKKKRILPVPNKRTKRRLPKIPRKLSRTSMIVNPPESLRDSIMTSSMLSNESMVVNPPESPTSYQPILPTKQKSIPALGQYALNKVKKPSTRLSKRLQEKYKCLNKLKTLRSKKIEKRFKNDKTMFGELYKLFKYIYDNKDIPYNKKKLIKNLPNKNGRFMGFYNNFKSNEINLFQFLAKKLGKQLHTDMCNGPCDKIITREEELHMFTNAKGFSRIFNGDLCDFVVNTTDYIKQKKPTTEVTISNDELVDLGLGDNYVQLIQELKDYTNKIISFLNKTKSNFKTKSNLVNAPFEESRPRAVIESERRPIESTYIYSPLKKNNDNNSIYGNTTPIANSGLRIIRNNHGYNIAESNHEYNIVESNNGHNIPRFTRIDNGHNNSQSVNDNKPQLPGTYAVAYPNEYNTAQGYNILQWPPVNSYTDPSGILANGKYENVVVNKNLPSPKKRNNKPPALPPRNMENGFVIVTNKNVNNSFKHTRKRKRNILGKIKQALQRTKKKPTAYVKVKTNTEKALRSLKDQIKTLQQNIKKYKEEINTHQKQLNKYEKQPHSQTKINNIRRTKNLITMKNNQINIDVNHIGVLNQQIKILNKNKLLKSY